jgi:hypothetical protein
MITLLDTQANDKQIAEMVNLVNGADSPELKVTVPDTG